jgi:hypothetical protein
MAILVSRRQPASGALINKADARLIFRADVL